MRYDNVDYTRVLRVLSTIDVVRGSLSLAVALFPFALLTPDPGSALEREYLTLAVLGVVIALLYLAKGVLGFLAAADVRRIGPAWVLSCIALVSNLGCFVYSWVAGTFSHDLPANLVSLAWAALAYSLTSGIRDTVLGRFPTTTNRYLGQGWDWR